MLSVCSFDRSGHMAEMWSACSLVDTIERFRKRHRITAQHKISCSAFSYAMPEMGVSQIGRSFVIT